MKPRTKLQKRVADLAKTLPELTERQKRWGYRIIKPVALYTSKRVWCTECGHVEYGDFDTLASTTGQFLCPNCGSLLELEQSKKKSVSNFVNVSYVTTHKGMQVVRTFEFAFTAIEGKKAQRECRETWQNWITEDGKEIILARKCQRTPFWFRWLYDSEMTVKEHNESCTGYFYYEDVYNTEGNFFYPTTRVIPLLRRNGWSGGLLKLRLDIVKLMRMMLQSSDIEWLVKSGQWKVLDYEVSKGNYQIPYKRQLQIATKNGYKIEDAQMWFDYLDLLDYFNKDLHNAHYLCPADLKKEHDRLVEKKEKAEEKKALDEKRKEIAEQEKDYQTARGAFIGLAFDDGRVFCHVLRDVQEFYEEGKRMHHCVYANEYFNVKEHPDSLILSARDKDGERIETVEVDIKSGSIIQSRGHCNQNTPRHGEIISLVDKYMPKIMRIAHTAISDKITL